MTRPAVPPSGWTRERFAMVVAVLFAAQGGLIFVFGARLNPPAPPPTPAVDFRGMAGIVSEDQLARMYFVGEPDIFLTPTRHGFSGRGWMNEAPAHYQPTNQLEQPAWLEFQPELLAKFHSVPDLNAAPPDETLDDFGNSPETEPPAVYLPPRVLPTQSVFYLEGPLASRLASPPPALQNWTLLQEPAASPQSPLLTNSVVQIAVTATGDVIAARLLARSGSPEADSDALAKARTLEFLPISHPGVQWAKAVFKWRTTPETNAVRPAK